MARHAAARARRLRSRLGAADLDRPAGRECPPERPRRRHRHRGRLARPPDRRARRPRASSPASPIRPTAAPTPSTSPSAAARSSTRSTTRSTALRLEVFADVPRKDVEAAIRVFKAIEAAAGRTERSGVTSADPLALQTRAMNLVRATFSYWYFSNRCRWQPEGCVRSRQTEPQNSRKPPATGGFFVAGPPTQRTSEMLKSTDDLRIKRHPRAPHARRGDARVPAHRRRDAHRARRPPRAPQHPPRQRRPPRRRRRPLLHPRSRRRARLRPPPARRSASASATGSKSSCASISRSRAPPSAGRA